MDSKNLQAVYQELVAHYGYDHPNAILVDAALRYQGTEAENARCHMAAFNAVAEDLQSIPVIAG